jgi:hypothetical protein
MIILDFLFNICFLPFRKVSVNGRLAALIWLTPSLSFTFMGFLIIFINLIFGIKILSAISALTASFLSLLIGFVIFLSLDYIYLKGNRDAGIVKFKFIYYLLLPTLVLGSIVFFPYLCINMVSILNSARSMCLPLPKHAISSTF